MAGPIYSEVTPATAPSAPSPATGTRREEPDSSGSPDSGARLAPKERHRRACRRSGASPSLAPPRHKPGGPRGAPTQTGGGRAALAAAARYPHLPLPSRPGLLSPFSLRSAQTGSSRTAPPALTKGFSATNAPSPAPAPSPLPRGSPSLPYCLPLPAPIPPASCPPPPPPLPAAHHGHRGQGQGHGQGSGAPRLPPAPGRLQL